jgi:polysaccharide biosynthesis protein PelF
VKVVLVSEGTYPYAVGGLSLWCDQLIRGLPEYRFEMVALTVDGTERQLWEQPDNLEYVQSIPLWGAAPAGRRSGQPGTAFTRPYGAFLHALLAPHDPRSDDATVTRSRFLLALRGLYEYAAEGGRLADALTSNRALAQMVDAWHDVYGGGLTLADALDAARAIERMLRPLSVPPVAADVVHSTMSGPSMLVAMATNWRHGTPVVMSEHGVYLRERYLSYLDDASTHAVKVLLLSFFRALAGSGYLIADAIAPHSHDNRRWQVHNGADPARIWTVYDGAELDRFPAADGEPDRPTVVFVGRIDPMNDLHTLIRAFARVRLKVPDARLRIFGQAPRGNELYRGSCMQLIRDLRLSGAVSLEGRAASQVAAYHAGTIVVLTSVCEGCSDSIVEAMACGRPVVCTGVGGVAEAVADTCVVVGPRDHRAIADACVRLLRDDELRRRMAVSARARAVELFTLRHSLDAYRRIYRRLAGTETGVEPRTRTAADPVPAQAGRHAELRPRVPGRVSVAANSLSGQGFPADVRTYRGIAAVPGRAR